MILYLLGGLLPAIFLVGIGQAFRPTLSETNRGQRWAEFLTASLGLLLGVTGLAALGLGEPGSSLVLVLLPALCALLAEIFLFLADHLALLGGGQSAVQFRGPAAIFLVDLALLAALGVFWDPFIIQAIVICGFTLALAWKVWDQAGKWQVILYLCLIGLLLFANWVADTQIRPVQNPAWLGAIVQTGTALIPGLGVVALARLLGWALSGEGRLSWRKLLAAGGLALPILVLFAAQAATASAWDVATDGLGGIFMMELISIFATAAVILLAWRLPESRRTPVFGLAILLPILISAANTFGTFGFDGEWGNVPHARTEQRAEIVHQAILRYHQRQGVYPQALADLTPSTLLVLPVPFIIPQQDWCYQGGVNFFRLGYVYREYFSTPASVKVHASAGQVPDLAWKCEAEAAKYPPYAEIPAP